MAMMKKRNLVRRKASEEEEAKPKSPTEEELKAVKEKEIEEKSAGEANQHSQTKRSLCKICLDIVECSQGGGGAKVAGEDMDT